GQKHGNASRAVIQPMIHGLILIAISYRIIVHAEPAHAAVGSTNSSPREFLANAAGDFEQLLPRQRRSRLVRSVSGCGRGWSQYTRVQGPADEGDLALQVVVVHVPQALAHGLVA